MSTENNLFGDETKKQIDKIRERMRTKKVGITFSCFDLLHPGHIRMLEDASNQCDILVIGLQTDPTIDRPQKNKPVQTFEEREIMIKAIKFVDEVIVYATESDVINILEYLMPDVRILGSDYVGKSFTGDEVPIKIHYHDRNHDWSSSDFRRRTYEAEALKKQLN